jgi:hypothetical protein
LVNFFNIIIYRSEIGYVISAHRAEETRKISKIIVGINKHLFPLFPYRQIFDKEL